MKYALNLNMEGIVNLSTPVSQIPKVEKRFNLAINVYGYTVSSRMKMINTFPFYISDQPKEQLRYNLLFISEDAESKYQYSAIKNLNRLHYGQNKHKGKT